LTFSKFPDRLPAQQSTIERPNKMNLSEEDLQIIREKVFEYNCIDGLVQIFYNPDTETPKIGVARLLKEYYELKAEKTEQYLEMVKKEHKYKN